ncbi:hypothetical protein Tco_1448132 [Tanacetum coccineum]
MLRPLTLQVNHNQDKWMKSSPPLHTLTSGGSLTDAKDFSFGDKFFNDKPSEANNEKTTADTEAESMVSVTIHQDTSVIPPMTSPVAAVKSAVSCRMASKVMAGVSDVDILLGGILST